MAEPRIVMELVVDTQFLVGSPCHLWKWQLKVLSGRLKNIGLLRYVVSGLSGGLEVDSTARPKIKSAFYCFLDQEGCYVDIVQLTTQKMYIV